MKTWTVGHSSHGFDVFVALLAAHGIALVADIRTVAKSGHHPHFHADALARSLPDRVAYLHLLRPGGWRPAARTRRRVPGGMSRFVDTPTTRWATSSSRGCLEDFY